MIEILGFAFDDVQREAFEILLAIDASRNQRHIFENNWRRLWQLILEVNAAEFPIDHTRGPWHLVGDPGRDDSLAPAIRADSFVVRLWPPELSRLQQELPAFLNWARVPVPHGS